MSLDDYDVIRELGRGGMAVVHLSRQRDLQRLVALKELSGFNASDPAFAERFLRESRMASSLNHPNIVTVYEYFEDGGVPYIAMELVEGGSLRPLIGDLSLPQVGRVLEDLLAAMAQAGRAGIAHRDLKPENALITKEGRVKVADFGIAKAAASGQAGLTSEGMTVGTPEYMSPEQALAKGVGPSSDLYAIGCMTYEMLTGRLPFENKSQAALLMSHVQDPVPDVRSVDPLIPDSVAEWVKRMTEKDPDDRFDDAAAAWEAFEEAVLEHIGPLWRRSAILEPSSEIDLSSIPPQTDTPLRPATSSQPAAAAGPETGYQTYHAPAALHEVLGTDTDDGLAAAAAAPAPAPARPAPRRGDRVVAALRRDPADRRAHGRRPRGARGARAAGRRDRGRRGRRRGHRVRRRHVERRRRGAGHRERRRDRAQGAGRLEGGDGPGAPDRRRGRRRACPRRRRRRRRRRGPPDSGSRGRGARGKRTGRARGARPPARPFA